MGMPTAMVVAELIAVSLLCPLTTSVIGVLSETQLVCNKTVSTKKTSINAQQNDYKFKFFLYPKKNPKNSRKSSMKLFYDTFPGFFN
jgi:hypothetical protein